MEQVFCLSINGKGCAIDNVFTDRLWRTVNYGYIYLNPPVGGLELYKGLKNWFEEYYTERRHQALDGLHPVTVRYANKDKIHPVGVLLCYATKF